MRADHAGPRYVQTPTARHPAGSGRETLLGAAALVIPLSLALIAIYWRMFEVHAADDIFHKYTDRVTYSLALVNYVNGRFVPGAIYQLLAWAGIDYEPYWTAMQAAAMVSLASLAYVFVTCLCLKLSRFENFALMSVVAFIPYLVIILINKNNALSATISCVAISSAIFFYSRSVGISRVVIPGIFLFLTISIYQTTSYYFIVFVISYHLFNGETRNAVLTGLAQGAAACAVAIVAYIACYKLTTDWVLRQLAYGAHAEVAAYYGDTRSQLNDLPGYVVAVLLYLHSLFRVSLGNEPILPLALKLWGVGILLLAYLGRRTDMAPIADLSAESAFRRGKQRFLTIALILAIGSPIHLLLANNWLPPRVFVHSGAIWAALLAWALVYGPQSRRRGLSAGVALFAAGLAYCTIDVNAGIRAQYSKDTEFARAIVQDLAQQPGYDAAKPIAVSGSHRPGSGEGKDIADYFGMTTSKFQLRRAQLGMLEEAAAIRLRHPSKEFSDVASSECDSTDLGRRAFKTLVMPQGAIVCLANRHPGY